MPEEKLKAIIAGKVEAALIDLEPQLLSFNRMTLRGQTKDGPVGIFSVRYPERLHGLNLRGFEFHPTADHPDIPARLRLECMTIAEHRLR